MLAHQWPAAMMADILMSDVIGRLQQQARRLRQVQMPT